MNLTLEQANAVAIDDVKQPMQPWRGFGYQQVRGLTDRILARWLRTQRKNMRRFFAANGMFDELERMEQIRKSRQGMLAKNQMFQEVLDAYIKRTTPQPATEAAPSQVERGLDVPPADPGIAVSAPDENGGRDAGAGLSEVAGTRSDEPVIEE